MGKIYGKQPLCWQCWEMLNGHREPVRVKNQEPIACAVCGSLHITGIFMRMKHDEVNFPNYDEDILREMHVGNLADPAMTGYDNRVVVCDECREVWPCPTIQRLDEQD